MSSFKLWLYKLLTSWLPESRCYGFKNALLRWAGAKIGKNVRIYSSASIIGNGELEIGDDVHIGPQVLIYPAAPAKVKIGSCVDIGPQVTILTGSHEINLCADPSDPLHGHIAGNGTAADVAISDGCWLGAKSLIFPGVTLPAKTVVAAGSVVTHPPSSSCSLIAGVPAQTKKQYQSLATSHITISDDEGQCS